MCKYLRKKEPLAWRSKGVFTYWNLLSLRALRSSSVDVWWVMLGLRVYYQWINMLAKAARVSMLLFKKFWFSIFYVYVVNLVLGLLVTWCPTTTAWFMEHRVLLSVILGHPPPQYSACQTLSRIWNILSELLTVTVTAIMVATPLHHYKVAARGARLRLPCGWLWQSCW